MFTNRLDLGVAIPKKSTRYTYFVGCKVKRACIRCTNQLLLDEIGIVAEIYDDKKHVGVIWPNNIVCVARKKKKPYYFY